MKSSSNPVTAPDPEAPSKSRLRLWIRILKASRLIVGDLRERLRVEFNTTLPRFDVMSALYRSETGLKMTELSAVLMVSNGNVTGIVDRLVQDGFALRGTVPEDKRAFRTKLTPKGRAEFERQAAAHEQWVDELLGNMEREDVLATSEFLAGLIRSLDRKDQ